MFKKTLLFSIIAVLAVLISTSGATALVDKNPNTTSALQQLGTGIAYQGYLEDSGGPVNDTCDFIFELYDALSEGVQIGSTLTRIGATVSDGYFTIAQLDFGANAFSGQERYLEIQVQCPSGSGGYATLSPRQSIMPTPYALALPGLYTTPGDESPNIVGGRIDNFVKNGVFGGTISGGGVSWGYNYVFDHVGTVSGGANNQAGSDDGDFWNADGATVGGGWNNAASAPIASVGGGANNASNVYAATVSGGENNTADDAFVTIGGGSWNYVTGSAATIAGGESNSIWGGSSTIGGGFTNTITADAAVITGGMDNLIEGWGGAIGGGTNNYASGYAATIVGGENNTASGDLSLAAGQDSHAEHNGSFVWSDTSGAFSSTGENQFNVLATGGVNFETGGAPFQVNGVEVGSASYANVVVVAKSGGDFTSIQSALDNIQDSSASNPYLVWVAPGLYNESVTMKENIHLQGAGQGATVITSTIGSNSFPPDMATLVITGSASVRDLTVVNTGTDAYNAAILARDLNANVLISNVTTYGYGSGTDSYGIFLKGDFISSMIELENVVSIGRFSNLTNYGVYIDSGYVFMYGGTFTGSCGDGGNDAKGIYNAIDGFLNAENVNATGGLGCINSVGLHNKGLAKLFGGLYRGTQGTNTRGIFNQSGSIIADTIQTAGYFCESECVGLYSYGAEFLELYHSRLVPEGYFGDETVIGLYSEADNATIQNSIVSANEGLTNIGILVEDSSGSGYSFQVNNSQVSGMDASVRNQSPWNVKIGSSFIPNGVDNTSTGTVTCLGVYTDSAFYADTCP